MINTILQSLLLIVGVVSFLMISKQDNKSIYGYYIGIASQPLWLVTSWMTGNWAVVCMVPFYIWGHIQGIKNFKKLG
jgi:hypothetical protein